MNWYCIFWVKINMISSNHILKFIINHITCPFIIYFKQELIINQNNQKLQSSFFFFTAVSWSIRSKIQVSDWERDKHRALTDGPSWCGETIQIWFGLLSIIKQQFSSSKQCVPESLQRIRITRTWGNLWMLSRLVHSVCRLHLSHIWKT